jgi:hypothetical protein
VGAFDDAARVYVRKATEITASDGHADFFTKGQVAALVGCRPSFHVPQPTALRAVQF